MKIDWEIRMRRNRKRGGLKIGTVGKSLLACLVIMLFGLGYVWQKNRIYRLGDGIKKREAHLISIQKRNTMLAAQLAHLKSPSQLEGQCKYYGLKLSAPAESQVVRLVEPGSEWDAPVPNKTGSGQRREFRSIEVFARR